MDDDFVSFCKRKLVSTKAHADFENWFAIGLFVSFLSYVLPAPDCSIPALHSKFLSQNNLLSFCQDSHDDRYLAMAWIGLSLLRIVLLASPWRAGPILRLRGLQIERASGRPVNIGFAARYALLEWLPVHILSIYVLIFGIAPDLYSIGSAIMLPVAAQLVWLAPAVFKYGGRNMAEFLTGGSVRFTSAKLEKIEKSYIKNRGRPFWIAASCLGKSGGPIYAVITIFFIFISIQILRAPDINPEYERLLYANRDPVWENNAYFAIEGLIAPADVEDSYAYGRAKALQTFSDYETLKKLAHIPYAYPVPAETGDQPKIREDRELKLESDKWKNLSCLFSVSPPPMDNDPCATWQDFQSYIQSNRTIWNRFNALPDYPLYRVVPPHPGDRGAISLMGVARLKAAQIADLAENGESEKAYQEWSRCWKLYRLMADAPDTMISKVLIGIVIAEHLQTFEKLLYLKPDLARNHGAEIRTALAPVGNSLPAMGRALADDAASLEPIFLPEAGNFNAIRNDFYVCVVNFQKLAELPASKYPFGHEPELCRLSGPNSLSGMTAYSFMQPGYVISNVALTIMLTGTLKGSIPVRNAIVRDAQMRMALLATEILEQEVTVRDVPGFIASAPAELQNPITQKPFEWDARTKSIFLTRPDTKKRYEFHLNLS
jgi:hypothetical protein